MQSVGFRGILLSMQVYLTNYLLAYQISEKRVKTVWKKYSSIEKYMIFKFKLLLCIH